MALTPMDIYNKEFKTAWKGYSRDQVDEFLDQIIIDFKSLLEGDGEVKTSPDEVRLKRFGRATRGYDADDVDSFLLQVAQDFSELLGQRRRAEEAARARKAGAQRVAPAPGAAPVMPEPPAPVREAAPAVPTPAPAPAPAPAAAEPVQMPEPGPAPMAPPLDPVPEPHAQPVPQPAPVTVTQAYTTPPRAGVGALPVEIPAGAGVIRLSLSGGRIFLTAEAHDLTVRKELDAAAARRLGEALLRMTETLER